MKKYISCLAGLLCLVLANICFAGTGSNEITYFSGELKSVSLIDDKGQEHSLGLSGHLSLDGEGLSKNIRVGDGGIPAGKYKAIKYVFGNKFTYKGKVTLNGEIYGSTRTTFSTRQFKKGQMPEEFTCVFPDDTYAGEDNGVKWCDVIIADGKLTVIEPDYITLDENSTTDYKVNVNVRCLWFGAENQWENFDSDVYVRVGTPDPANDIFGLSADGNTLTAPSIDPPEIDRNF